MGWRKQQLAGLKGFQMQPKMDLLMKRQLKQNRSLASQRTREVVALTFQCFADTFCITKSNVEAFGCATMLQRCIIILRTLWAFLREASYV